MTTTPPGSLDAVAGRPTAPSSAAATASPALRHACEAVPSAEARRRPVDVDDGSRRSPAVRLVGIDAARGLALIGMMSVHTIEATGPGGDVSWAWVIASGKAAALFAVLAGVGVAFTSGRRERPTGRAWTAEAAALLVRALAIGAVGLLLGSVVPDDLAAVILPYYAMLFVLAIPLLSLSMRALVAFAALIVVTVPVVSHLARAGTDFGNAPNLTFGYLAEDPTAFVRDLALTGDYPALAWMAYLCVGLAVGRAMLSSRKTVALITLVGAALVVLAQTASWLVLDVFGGRADLHAVALRSMSREDVQSTLALGWDGTTPTDTPWWLATAAPHSSTPLDLVFTIGTSLAVLGICILLGRMTTVLLRPLAAAGSMPLTLYCLHLVLLSWPPSPGGTTGLLVHAVLAILFAVVWRHSHARGPLEEIVAQATGAVRRRLRSGRRSDGTAEAPITNSRGEGNR